MPRSEARKREEIARLIPSRIAAREHGTSITFAARTRPRCRSPIFTTGSRKEGASVNPLEEFPTMTAKCFRQLR